jgi:putative heme-binding domain-containing protein
MRKTAAMLALVGLHLLLIAPVQGADPAKPANPVPGPLSPSDAFQHLKVAGDLQLEQVLAEPVVAQPIFMTFDERGRLWVIQYLQYPYPAGLKILSEDKFLRAVYDKIPPPPPHHFRGRDKITIHEDTHGSGSFDKHTTFVEGLNIATSCAMGKGGVWVLNPPYLLFYPTKQDRNRPSADPIVHLEGFGLEDTHSCANNLQWGPDGWLYAAQGSTVSGTIKHYGVKEEPVHSMGQLIWRYHPETHRYEIFAEGGGNAFGLEIDAKGRIFSGHNGGDTRGFHYVQGGYFQKGFAKHGPLSNPYTFGYFPAMKHPSVPRFTHAFVIYDGNTLPDRYRGNIVAVAPLQNHVVASSLLPDGSSFQTKDFGHPIISTDTWFRPVNITVGPEGAVYVADMYEGQIAHLRHHEGKIDITNGRIYRLQTPAAVPLKPFDLSKLATADLVELLHHPNKWQRRTSLRLLSERQDPEAIPLLRKLLDKGTDQDALEALWGLHLCGVFNDDLALHALNHPDPFVRQWTVRLLGDANRVSPTMSQRLAALARTEYHVEVRSQLACSAKRLPAGDCLAIVRNLLGRDEDVNDIHVPLLLWWAIEAKCASDRDQVLSLFTDPGLWRLPLVQTHILHRLMRRFAAVGTRKDLLTCAQLLHQAPDPERSKLLLRGFEEAFQGRSLGSLPTELTEALAKLGGGSTLLALRQNRPEAVAKALTVLANDKADASERLQYAQVFGEVRQPRCLPILLSIVERSPDDSLRMAALTALQLYDDAKIGTAVVALYSKFTDAPRSVAQTLLVSRKAWLLALLEAVDAGKLDRTTIPEDVVRKMTLHRDPRITQLVAKHWGNVEGATTAAMQQQIERLEGILRSGSGSPYQGKKLFNNTCAKCHRLFGQGGQIGPDLTTYKRDDIVNMLVNIVNPSAEIREGFETMLVTTKDGRVLTGFLVDKDNQVLVLRGADGQNISIPQNQVEEVVQQRKSLMPEGLLKDLTNQQVRDLFAYLRSTQPLNE